MDKPLYFKENWLKMYADKRKALSQEDVNDLYRCLFKFLKENVESVKSKHYAIEIPMIGTMYTKMKHHNIGTANQERYIHQLKDIMFTERDKSLLLKRDRMDRLTGIKIEELEILQNELAENSRNS